MLPAVRPSTDVVGTLRPDVAAELGLPATCAGRRRHGRRARGIGRGRRHRVRGRRRRHRHRGTGDDGRGRTRPRSARRGGDTRPRGTGVVADREPRLRQRRQHALARQGLLGIPQAEIFTRAREAPPASDGVLFLPALSGSTAPRWNDAMRGAFLGLAMNHTSAHAARAVLEGCAYALRDIVDRLDALGLGHGEVRIVGGGARDDLWASIKADVLGRPMRRVLTEEATAVGAAMVAGVGTGVFADFSAASVAVHLDPDVIEPDPATPTAVRRRLWPLPRRVRRRRVSVGQAVSDRDRSRTRTPSSRACATRVTTTCPTSTSASAPRCWTARSPTRAPAGHARSGDHQRRRPVPHVRRTRGGSAGRRNSAAR